MNIEGIPEGWELVRLGTPSLGEFYLNPKFGVVESKEEATCIYPILKQKPKTYRPFASAAEFMPYRHKWVRLEPDSSSHTRWQIARYDDTGVTLVNGRNITNLTFNDAFIMNRFDDDTFFGVEDRRG